MIRLYSRDPLGLKLHLDYWFDDSVKTSKSLSMRKFSQQVRNFSGISTENHAIPCTNTALGCKT